MQIPAFKQEILTKFLDENNFVKPRIDQGSKNGIMYSGLFYTILAENNLLTKQPESLSNEFDSSRWAIAFNKCIRYIDSTTQTKINALIFRSPTDMDGEAQDDYIGAVAACYHFGFPWPHDLVTYGEKYGWILNNAKPYDTETLKYWHDRFPGLTTFYKIAANSFHDKKDPSKFPKFSVGAWDLVVLCIVILANAFSKLHNEDSKMLTYMQLTVLSKEKPFPFVLIRKLWFFIINRRLGSLAKSWIPYFGADHPFCQVELK